MSTDLKMTPCWQHQQTRCPHVSHSIYEWNILLYSIYTFKWVHYCTVCHYLCTSVHSSHRYVQPPRRTVNEQFVGLTFGLNDDIVLMGLTRDKTLWIILHNGWLGPSPIQQNSCARFTPERNTTTACVNVSPSCRLKHKTRTTAKQQMLHLKHKCTVF